MPCARCNKGPIITDPATGEEFCGHCGLVVNDRVESMNSDYHRNNERRASEGQKDLSHHGPLEHLLLYQPHVSLIGDAKFDCNGDKIPAEQRAYYNKLRRRVFAKRTETMSVLHVRGLEAIMAIGDKLSVPTATQERAAYILRRVAKKRKGSNSAMLAAASIYFACKEQGIIRTLEAICDAVGESKKGVFHHIERIRIYEMVNTGTNLESAERYVLAFNDTLKLDQHIIKRAIELAKLAEMDFAGKRRKIIAAGCIWRAANEYYPNQAECAKIVRQDNLAELSGCTTVSIRSIARELEQLVLSQRNGH